MIKVIHYVNSIPTLKEIDENDLSQVRDLVGGHIEIVPLPFNTICVCNEEGNLKGLYANIRIGHNIIAGDCFICRVKGEDLDSVTDDDIKRLM
jgi:agmatine/peptidylarginine deiminase